MIKRSYFLPTCAGRCPYFHLLVSDKNGKTRTMPGYPYLTFGEIEVQKEKYSLPCDESLYVMRHQLFADIDHLEDKPIVIRGCTLQYWRFSTFSSCSPIGS